MTEDGPETGEEGAAAADEPGADGGESVAESGDLGSESVDTSADDGVDRELPLDDDELAGIVELFGALDREELHRAASELLYRRGEDPDAQPIGAAIDAATETYTLVVAPGAADPAPDGDPIVAGPTAFPSIPDRAEDLPHILDAESRSVDRETAGTAVASRYREAVETTIDADDPARAERLLDLGYEIESWAPLDLEPERDRLATLVEQ